jgi:hypothetical protein
LAFSLLGCGPTRSTTLIIEAAAELAAAGTAQAGGSAPYEFVAAEEYLHKAREEQSYSEFEVAEDLAIKARDCARVARAKAEAGTPAQLGGAPQAVKARSICVVGPVGTVTEDPNAMRAPAPAADAPAAPPPAQTAPKKPVKPKEDEPDDPMPDGEEPG